MTTQELITATLADKSEIELRDIATELQLALAKSEETAGQRWNWWQAAEERVNQANEKINAIKTMIAVI